MDGLDALTGIEFENLIKHLLELMGFHTEMTKASGDGGIDIIATLDQPLTGGRYLIQCKRYATDSLVGSATVREFYGALTANRRAAKGILITTSGFTAQALEFAENLPIELIGGAQLEQLLRQNGLELSASGQRFDTVEALPPEDRALLLLNSAIKLSEEQKYAEAIKELREATQLQSDNPVLWLWLGICYNFAGLHDDEIASFREAVRLSPGFGDAWFWLGRSLRRAGERDAAMDALEHASALLPDSAETWTELADIYVEKGKRELARMAYQRATAIKPDSAHAWRGIGVSRYFSQEYTEAISAFQEALRNDPVDSLSWGWLTHAYRNIGDRPRMTQALLRLEELDPTQAQQFRHNFLGR